jgi:hypothetical protein
MPKLWAKPPPLESAIERKFCEEVRKLGCKTRKLNGPGARSWPDQMVLTPNGYVLFIEFKREGKTLTSIQKILHDELHVMNHGAWCFDNWRDPLELVAQVCRFENRYPPV